MFNKKLQKFSIRKLSVGAASVLIGISFISMRDNNTVHAADMPVATTAQNSQDKLSVAKTNIDKAQTEVNNAQTKLNDAENNLYDAQNKANKADAAYENQGIKTLNAQKDAEDKKKDLDYTNTQVSNAQKAVDYANKPGVKENAQKNITDRETALNKAQEAEKAAEAKANDAAQEVAKSTQDVNSKQSDVNAKQADKNKADADVKAAQDALKGTGVEEASKALTDANNKVSQDQNNLKNADKAVDQATQEKNKSDKNLADAQSVVDKANKDQQNAQTDYDAKKQASDEANKPVVEKQNEKDQLQKQLDDLKDKSKNNIVISDVDRFKQAYAYAMQHDEMMSDADVAWTKEEYSKNHYISSEADKKEIVVPNNLTDAQIEELSLFASDLESKVRAQLGFGPDQVSKGSIDLAKAVAKRYEADKWKEHWHDAVGINDVSKELGLDSNEKSNRDTWQYYEDAWLNKFFTQDDKYQNLTESTTMDKLKSWVYDTLLEMILPAEEGSVSPTKSGYEMAHTSGVLGIKWNDKTKKVEDSTNGSPTINEIEDLKDSLTNLYNDVIQQHFSSPTDITVAVPDLNPDSDYAIANNHVGVDLMVIERTDNTSSGIKTTYVPSYLVSTDNIHYLTVSKDKFLQEINDLQKKCDDDIKILRQKEGVSSYASAIFSNPYKNSDVNYRTFLNKDGYFDHQEKYDTESVVWDMHLLNVNPYNIKDSSKFSTEIIPSYTRQIKDVTQKLEAASKELIELQNEAKPKNEATTQAQQVLANAQNVVQAAQKALNNAQTVNNNAQSTLTKAQNAQAQLQTKLSNDQKDQKAKQAAYNKLSADQKHKADILNANLAAQTKAANALKDAQTALVNAQSKLNDAKQKQNQANIDVSAKKASIQVAQNAVKNAKSYLASLTNAPVFLAKTLDDKTVAQNDYDTAKKNADNEAKQLDKLKQAKTAADDKVKSAQDVVTKAKENLTSARNALTNAQNAYTAIEDEIASENAALNTDNSTASDKETPMTGVAHIKNNVTLVNGKGEAVSQTINADTNYKVFAKKTINGKTYYRLGTDNQWVVEDAVDSITDGVPAKSDTEEPFAAHGYIPVLKSHPTWKIALVDGNGNYTGQYLPTNTKWKVFAKKIINGQTYYRLGTDQQWIPATFLQVKKTGVVKANPVKNHPTWKIALLNQNGEYTGEFVKPNTSWKVLDVEFINGRMMARIGNQAQWIPMDYVAWVK